MIEVFVTFLVDFRLPFYFENIVFFTTRRKLKIFSVVGQFRNIGRISLSANDAVDVRFENVLAVLRFEGSVCMCVV